MFLKKTKENKSEYKDPYSPTKYESRKVALEKKLSTYSKASILFNYLLEKINSFDVKKDTEIVVSFKELFKDAKTKKINGSVYADKRFPNYFLDLAELDKDFSYSNTIIRDTNKDGLNGGIVKDALLEFKLIYKVDKKK